MVRQEAIRTFISRQRAVLQGWTQKWAHCLVRRFFTEWTALSRDLDWVLAALFAGHGCTVWFSVHTLAEGAVIFFPLFLMSSQLIIHPTARHSAIHRQQLHIYADRAALALRNVEVLTVQLRTLSLGAEGDTSTTLTQPTRVHSVYIPFHKLLPVVEALRSDFLALKHITAVSWLPAGLAQPHSALACGTLGLVAGVEVTGALGGNGGAAASRGSVALSQDRAFGTGHHCQRGTGHI